MMNDEQDRYIQRLTGFPDWKPGLHDVTLLTFDDSTHAIERFSHELVKRVGLNGAIIHYVQLNLTIPISIESEPVN
jgi:hypothetical protein